MGAVAVRWMSLEWRKEGDGTTESSDEEANRVGQENIVIRPAGMSAVVKRGMCDQRASSPERSKYIVSVLRCSSLRDGAPRGES